MFSFFLLRHNLSCAIWVIPFPSIFFLPNVQYLKLEKLPLSTAVMNFKSSFFSSCSIKEDDNDVLLVWTLLLITWAILLFFSNSWDFILYPSLHNIQSFFNPLTSVLNPIYSSKATSILMCPTQWYSGRSTKKIK